MNELLQGSQEIIKRAVADYRPYATVLMFSGGNDSKLTYYVAKSLGIKIDFILHGITGTGILDTTEHVRQFAASVDSPYIEANADDAYNRYAQRKGFFGVGETAHKFAYHLLKAGPFRHAISKHIRQGQRNRPVLLLNGARIEESLNRSKNFTTPFNADPAAPRNVWVNLCHYWNKAARDEFLSDCNAPVNPVTRDLCRSGECACGTTQGKPLRYEIDALGLRHTSGLKWGKWLTQLENEVYARGFDWGWGDDMSPVAKAERAGQLPLFSEFQPACVSCNATMQETP